MTELEKKKNNLIRCSIRQREKTMNKHLQHLLQIIQQDKSLTADQKNAALKSLKDADKELEVTAFKLDRTEKVKQTTAVLLEETIAELEQKRKAVEEQNRELEIEAALEKIRSRSLAMHKSEELQEVATTIYERLHDLKIEMDFANLLSLIEGSKDYHVWVSGLSKPIRIPFNDFTEVQRIYNGLMERREELFTHTFSGEMRNEYYQFLLQQTDLGKNLPEAQKKHLLESPFNTASLAVTRNTCIQLVRLSDKAFSKEENGILKRFAKVFEQTYTRFLDLQKAEAQAREAKIEAALERVRSRTMAMQRSEELPNAALLMFQQLQALGVSQFACSFNIWDDDRKASTCWGAREDALAPPFKTSSSKDIFVHILEAAQRGEQLFIAEQRGEELETHYRYMMTIPEVKVIAEELSKHGLSFPTFQIVHCAFFSQGYLMFITYERVPEAHDIFKRFGKVFDQTYTRFLDLQKAEAQAREATIEAALERVRSRSMGMQKSEELKEVIQVTYDQLVHLNIHVDQAGFVMDYKESEGWNLWVATNLEAPSKQHIPYFESKNWNLFLEAKEKGLDFYALTLTFEEKNKFFQKCGEYIPGMPEETMQAIYSYPGLAMSVVLLNNVCLYIDNLLGTPYSDAENATLIRFGKVFEQTYTRFLDLQKAEAQAREAKIEVSLERVRASAMAMHNSEDLTNTIKVFYQQIGLLSETPRRCGIDIIDKDTHSVEISSMNTTEEGKPLEAIGKILLKGHRVLEGIYDNWLLQKEYYPVLKDDEIREYYDFVRPHVGYPDYIQDEVHYGHFFSFPEGCIYVWTTKGLSEDELKIYRRFTSVFSLTYKRYKDLLHAEAQAREAQIEAALERVRSRSMAMQKSEELRDVIQVVFQQFQELNFKLDAASFNLDYRESDDLNAWIASSVLTYPTKILVPYIDNDVIKMHKEAKEKRLDFSTGTVSFEEKSKFWEHFFNHAPVPPERQQYILSAPGFATSLVLMSNVSLFIVNYAGIPFSEGENAILKRFGKVFQQTYTRFLDLQKAEAQAREAQIEAALEKVRGKAMAMHNSNDLMATAGVVFTELRRLGINSFRGGVGLINNKESRTVKMYSAISSQEGDTLSLPGTIILEGHPVLSKIWDCLIDQSDYFPVLKGELLESYYSKISSTFKVPLTQSKYNEEHGCFLIFSGGAFYVWSEKPYTEAEIRILHRFKTIIDLTFRRYIELQKSEANALEAVRSASLDRVRAEIASMRTTADLEKITPLIWKELTILGIPFARCGIFIMDEKEEMIHTFLSTPDGKAIAAFHLSYTSSPFVDAIDKWRAKKIHVTHRDAEGFSALADSFVKEGQIATREQYLSTVPKDGLYLHYVPFLQGVLYVGNTTSLSGDSLHLVQSVADAFSTAYARYEDFNKIESAKAQVEKTLVDLKLAQSQLVQSEKMASLGELTAGIAHEIQNPLNFVNNFSEVNTELIKEIQDERRKTQDKRDEKLEDELLQDIVQNQEKINHHGKRAADIVKGMLQHSRSSSGVKEPTDINALADEYLRLAYHGLRAKDKSFNAELKTDFDESIGNINIIPQDIGRVILNLITNAFYVVNEKAKQNIAGYEPTVSVSTKKDGNKVLISVKDNGNGIPEHVKEKIFQPFFTTKPTGQGTGLGLSLSYDIVKAHGGELRAETQEGAGSEFVISLPF